MVSISHALLRILSLVFWYQTPTFMTLGDLSTPPKSIAIIGAGSAGLAMLKTVLDLPAHSAEKWEVVLYEDRESVGGVWQVKSFFSFSNDIYQVTRKQAARPP